jgi:hypothetical protein
MKIKEVAINRTRSLDGKDNKFTHNFDEKMSCKVATWKTEMEMGG